MDYEAIVVGGGFGGMTAARDLHDAGHSVLVLEVAVVARPDARYGERPVAFVRLVPGSDVGESEIVAHVRARLAHFKAPSEVIVRDELPRTATGKVQKYVLREQVQAALASAQNSQIER